MAGATGARGVKEPLRVGCGPSGGCFRLARRWVDAERHPSAGTPHRRHYEHFQE